MNDHHAPLSDEDLSAAIDGEAGDEILRRLAADPDARARRDELAAVATRLGALPTPTLDAEAVDALVSGALDAPVAPAQPAAGGGRGPATWLVAAVIVALVAVGLGLIWNGINNSSEQARFTTVGDSISAESRSSGAADKAGDSEATAGSGGHGLATTVPSVAGSSTAPLVGLGTFATADDLREALAAVPPGGTSWQDLRPADPVEPTVPSDPTVSAMAPPSDEAAARCAEQLKVTLKLGGDPLQQGYATVGDKPVLVYEFESTSYADGSPTTLVAAVGVDACDPVATFER